MKDLKQELESYLEAAMGLQVVAPEQSQQGALPHFLAQLYEPRPMQVNGRLWLAVFLREGADLRPAAFEKHVHQLSWGSAEGYFLVARGLPGYVRKRLIERRIPFVIPGSQLYLPQMGMELRPKQPRADAQSVPLEKMSPATQLVVILALNNRLEPTVSPLMLAHLTGYTPMTMTRAWNELEALGLGVQLREGRQRLLSFPEGLRALWERARHFMRSPVQDSFRVRVSALALGRPLLAGTSALAEASRLAAPRMPIYAVSREEWGEIRRAGFEHIPLEEPGTCWMQVWRYPPGLISRLPQVDPFSLCLSLQGETDERVQAALEEMMEQHQW